MISGLDRRVQFVPLAAMFNRTTVRQRGALLRAIESGCYSTPRRTTLRATPRYLSVPRTTFEDHVHKAEVKMISTLGPYLSLRLRPSG